ncbi:MAG: anti-sigma factor antagonist [Clostridia bacterium]|nr:anti-sigma factor antagonist [Clostridia bacterium]
MSEITFTSTGSKLIVNLEGYIDSANAAEVENKINEIKDNNPCGSLELNCENLKYMSSAGLRIVLRLKKSIPDTVVTNVSSEVYEIFDMTGFTEMMEIRKAFRTVSVEGCEIIGEGANGKVYRIDPDTIVKVYLNPDSLPEIERERELARTAFVLGIPTAIPYDVVRIENGGYGSVFELLNAKSFAKLLQTGEKSVDEIAKMSVDLLKLIHSTVVKPDSVPDMKTVAIKWANFLKDYLPEDKFNKLSKLVQDVPDDMHMMHGDYHIKNVMLQNGEVLLIDMDTICHGHPVFELASMYNAYLGYTELDHSIAMSFLGIPYETAVELWQKSLSLYLGTDDEKLLSSVEDKAKLLGYTRIMRRSIKRKGFDSPVGKAEIENAKNHILELLSTVDSLIW